MPVEPITRTVATTGPGPVVTLKQAAWALMFVGLYVVVAAVVMIGIGMSGLVEFTLETVNHFSFVWLTVAVLLALYLHLIRRNSLTAADLGFRRPGPRTVHLLWQIPAAIIAATCVQGLFRGLLTDIGLVTVSAGPAHPRLADVRGLSAPIAAVTVLVLAVLTPLWEEVLFRGAFLDGFSRHFRPALAAALTAALFAVFHALLGFAYLFTLGVALAMLRRFHQNIWAPILLHTVNNSLAVCGFFIFT